MLGFMQDHSLVINSLPALLDQQEPDVACVQDGSIEGSNCDNNLCTTKSDERNASNEQPLLPDLNELQDLNYYGNEKVKNSFIQHNRK